ncbi:MAG: dephospho-CoA kinase [Synergistaceae bacterium]|jgi:dephospho-CoA kinase|nr:dephospho-CoA kinase [Synergistaceae bacterium]
MAITGDVGAGKSTVAKMFRSLGGFLIDADRVVAELWQTPEMTAAAVGRWGEAVLGESGHVRHQAIAERIFDDRVEYDWVTGLVHPRVMKEIERQIECQIEGRIQCPTETRRWGIVEIPLLFEAGVAPWVTVTAFVTASKETRAARCRQRGWSEAEMTKRESFFLPGKERMERSDYVIHNDGGLRELEEAVEEVYTKAIYPKGGL